MRHSFSPTLRFGAILVLTGVASGIIGATCHWILDAIEHSIWGKGGLGNHTLIEGAMYTTPLYRFGMLIAAGCVAALSWTLMVRTGAIPRISQAISGGVMPIFRTLWHTLTQVVIVAMGASAGREAAPREMASSVGAQIASRFGLSGTDRRIVVACAAGAGLAAVYSIPLSGFFFTLEVMLLTRNLRAIFACAVVNTIAVMVASGGDLSHSFYEVPQMRPSLSLLGWAVVCGPILGVSGLLFRRGVRWAEARRPEDLRLSWSLPLAFIWVGLIAAVTPTILGNGQASAQTFFHTHIYQLPGGLSHVGSADVRALSWLPWDVTPYFNSGSMLTLGSSIIVVAALTLAKVLATVATIRAGAWGGTLTPGLAVGAGVSATLGLAWTMLWPEPNVAAFVFIGAGTFLGVSLNAPVTGMVLLVEFTRIYDAPVILPFVLCIVTAQLTVALIDGRRRLRAQGGGHLPRHSHT